jgi:V/A-type H+-transporting ATPase subunit I
MTPVRRLREEWINHAMLPLTLMSNFGDVLSYIRLFALGVASVQLASAFNSIVTESLGFSSPLAGLFSALLLFAGHTVNIVLSLMSVLVHGIRLNALEFSMHMGLEWTGTAYRPFALPQPLAAYPGPGAAEAAQSVQTREA